MEWRFNGSLVPPWQTHEGLLTLLNTTHSMEGNYSCHDERGTLLQSIKLRLGRKSNSAIQESLVLCFDAQCVSFDKMYDGKWLNRLGLFGQKVTGNILKTKFNAPFA